MMKKGYFITFEGGDGAGKSTQIKKLMEYLESKGFDVILTREPGGTDIGEKIRQIILDPENKEMDSVTEAMLYAASRAQHVSQVIKPAIEAGKIVICDRFIDSSIAYQGYGRNLGDSVSIINSYAVGEYMPHKTFLLKLKPQAGSLRMAGREKDRIELEAASFHQTVYDGYEALERKYPERIVGIDASGTIEEIADEIKKHIDVLLSE
ncbi:MAG: dTMP kinase [Bacillota bacterium]|nr:dTMP kinase [Bacillota bacterium]